MLTTQHQNTKIINVMRPGSDRPVEELSITPTVTPRDVLRAMKLNPDSFALAGEEAGSFFAKDEPLYNAVHNGSSVYVTTPIDAG